MLQKFWNKGKLIFLAALVALTMPVSNALAVLSTDQQAAVDGVNTLITDLTTVAWAMVLAILSVTIGIKLMKKFLGKAT